MDQKSTGVFICTGCEIGQSLEIEKLCKAAESFSVKYCVSHGALCSVEGYDKISKSIEEDKLNSLLIAACSPRSKEEVFDFPDQVLLERVDLREPVVWGMDAQNEDH